MGNELAIDGVEEGRAFTVAIDPLVVEEVAEFFHGVRRCLAKVAGVGWFRSSPGQNSILSRLLARCSRSVNSTLPFDEPAISIDEKKNFSRQHAWEFQMCFSIFIAKTTFNDGLTL